MTEPNGQDYRYWAFISYSHKDRKWAQWLHRAIESYGVPAQLYSHTTPTGEPAPKRLKPVFRDREELPAASDLGREVETALQSSRYLIIICSPNAARSQWVQKEIESFRALGRQDRILALIVEGEPNTSDDRECFPPSLKVFEPIAADARSQGDGRNHAKLKLLAGMLGVGFDALKQRDNQRRIRRLEISLSSALVLIVTLVGLVLYANQQRDKAVKSRQQAEDVIQFLLQDLREVLQPVGRLDIMAKVQTKVDDYYRKFSVKESSTSNLYNRARAQRSAGELAWAQGDLSAALQAYRAGLETTQHLCAADPSNTEWQRFLASCYRLVGLTLKEQGDLAGALQEYRAGLEIAKRLTATDSSNVKWRYELLSGHLSVGRVLRDQGDLKGAQREYQLGLEIGDRLLTADSTNVTWRQDLANVHLAMSWLYSAQGNKSEKLAALRKYQQDQESLAATDTSNIEWQRSLLFSHSYLGDELRWQQGDLAGALQEYRAALEVAERAAATVPSNVGWLGEVSFCHTRLGDALLKQGDPTKALQEYRIALEISERLSAADPTNTRWQRDLWYIHLQLGHALRAQHDLTGALQEYRASLEIVKSLTVADSSNTGWQKDLSSSYYRVGDVLNKLGDVKGALESYQAELEICGRLVAADSANGEWQRYLCGSYWNIAELLEQSGEAQAGNYWRRAYDVLAGMKRAGMSFSSRDELDLDTLRKKVGDGP